MSYKVLYHPDILHEDLPKIPQNVKTTIRRAIEERLLGDYRVIYKIQGKELVVLKIGHRREVYGKVFPRLLFP